MINIRRISAKSAGLLVIAVCLIIPAAACTPALPVHLPPPGNPPPSPILSQSPAPALDSQPIAGPGNTEFNITDNASQQQPGPGVEIMLIHNRGTLTRIGCCNPLFYERDEFVVIQNRSDMAQDITGWSLTNITRGYPTFRFPTLFPCLPYTIPAVYEENATESTYNVAQNPAQSVINRLSTNPTPTKPTNQPASEVNWASCSPVEPLDQTPMKPASGRQGMPAPCVLYPGQTILVFTDEIHCSSGGFSFNWGQGNIWDNETPDTAVLYNSDGNEVSRRSYTVGR